MNHTSFRTQSSNLHLDQFAYVQQYSMSCDERIPSNGNLEGIGSPATREYVYRQDGGRVALRCSKPRYAKPNQAVLSSIQQDPPFAMALANPCAPPEIVSHTIVNINNQALAFNLQWLPRLVLHQYHKYRQSFLVRTVETVMDIMSSSPISTPLGLAACAVLLALSFLWRRKHVKSNDSRIIDLKEKGIIHAPCRGFKTNHFHSLLSDTVT